MLIFSYYVIKQQHANFSHAFHYSNKRVTDSSLIYDKH